MVEQLTALPPQTAETVVSVALSTLTHEFWTMVGLTAVGMASGMAVVGFIRIMMWDVSAAPPDIRQARSILLTKIGALMALSWTLFVIMQYCRVTFGFGLGTSFTIALAPALVAGATNHLAFKPVRLVWDWAMGWLKKRFGGGQ